MDGTVYRIFCTANGKSYIGQTWQTLEERWRRHRSKSSCIKLKNALMKYGADRFVIAPLTKELKTQEDADAAERYWIGYFNSIEDGYNIREGGSKGKHSEETKIKISEALKGTTRGSPSKETKEKMSKANLGKRRSEETRAKIKKANLGKHLSEETKAKISESSLGKRVSEETKAKISEARRGHITSQETKDKMSNSQVKKLIVDQNGIVYDGVNIAARTLGISPGNISAVLHSRRKTCNSYIFKFVEENSNGR